MKWGKRKAPQPTKLEARDSDTKLTKQAKKDYGKMDDASFQAKYATSKKSYAKRVEKHGDPYAKRFSEKDRSILEARDRQADREIKMTQAAFSTYTAKGKKETEAAVAKYEKLESKYLSNPDRDTAAQMTKGEKTVAAINGTIIAAALLGSAALAIKG